MTAQIQTPPIPVSFEHHYQHLLKCLKLNGMQPKTIALYSHGVRRAAAYFNHEIDTLIKMAQGGRRYREGRSAGVLAMEATPANRRGNRIGMYWKLNCPWLTQHINMLREQVVAVALQQIHGEKIGASRMPGTLMIGHDGSISVSAMRRMPFGYCALRLLADVSSPRLFAVFLS